MGPGPQGPSQIGSWALPVPTLLWTEGSEQHTATISSLHGPPRAPGLSSETEMYSWRRSKGPPTPAQPHLQAPRGLTCIFSIISNRSVFCNRGQESISQSAGGPADPAEPPRSLHPPICPGPPGSDQLSWAWQPRAWAPAGQPTQLSPFPQRRRPVPQTEGCDP